MIYKWVKKYHPRGYKKHQSRNLFTGWNENMLFFSLFQSIFRCRLSCLFPQVFFGVQTFLSLFSSLLRSLSPLFRCAHSLVSFLKTSSLSLLKSCRLFCFFPQVFFALSPLFFDVRTLLSLFSKLLRSLSSKVLQTLLSLSSSLLHWRHFLGDVPPTNLIHGRKMSPVNEIHVYDLFVVDKKIKFYPRI